MFDKEKFTVLLTSFLSYLKDVLLFTGETISRYKRRLEEFFLFLEIRDLEFDHDSLELFFTARAEGLIPVTYHTDNDFRVTFRRFVDFIENREFSFCKSKKYSIALPIEAQSILDSYLIYCRDVLQNADYTIDKKQKFVGNFLMECVLFCNLHPFEFSPQGIQNSILRLTDRNNSWPVIRLFLHYCYTENFTEINYSYLIPKLKREEKIHSSYTEEELKAVESVIDTTTIKGKRDMVMFLLASRLGIRIGDITNLKLENIDFSNHRINFTQQKTGGEMSLPLLPEIEEALIEYLKVRERPQEECIFLAAKAPHNNVTTNAFKYALGEYFEKASVNITGKKHGPHSLRASLISSMIRDEVPYESIKEIVGQSSRNAITHYAKIDIPELRKCVLKPLEITGNLKKAINKED